MIFLGSIILIILRGIWNRLDGTTAKFVIKSQGISRELCSLNRKLAGCKRCKRSVCTDCSKDKVSVPPLNYADVPKGGWKSNQLDRSGL